MIRSSIVKEYLIPVAALVAALLAVDPGQLIKNVTGYATPLSGYWWLAIAVLSPAFCAYFARAYLKSGPGFCLFRRRGFSGARRVTSGCSVRKSPGKLL